MWKRSDPVESANLTPTPDPAPERALPEPSAAPPSMPDGGPATIGQSVVIKGELTGSEDLATEGRIEGKIELQQHVVTIGQHATVRAQVSAREVVVLGHVVGNIKATDKVDIKEHGRVEGDIVSPTVAIADGAHFHGSIDMQRATTQTDKAAGKDAAAILNSRSSRTEPRPQPVAQSIKIGPPRPHSTHA